MRGADETDQTRPRRNATPRHRRHSRYHEALRLAPCVPRAPTEETDVPLIRSSTAAWLSTACLLATAALAAAPAAHPPEAGGVDPLRAAGEPTPADSTGEAYALDFLDEFTRAKLRKNGEYLFCDQPGYLDCFKVTRQQCLDELTPLKAGCLARADQKFPDRMRDERAVDRYAGYFSVCMMLQHSASKDANALGACLRQVDWDKAQRDRSLLK